MTVPSDNQQKPVFLSFENCNEKAVPLLLTKLRPLLFDFCLKHRCFYTLYTKTGVDNIFTFGLKFYFCTPGSNDELATAVAQTFVKYFSNENNVCGFVKCSRFIPVQQGFFKVFKPVVAGDHIKLVVKPQSKSTANDIYFLLTEKFEFNRLVFDKERRLITLNRLYYCGERPSGKTLLIQNDANFNGEIVAKFIKENPEIFGTLAYHSLVSKEKHKIALFCKTEKSFFIIRRFFSLLGLTA
jgi:hypothetical protein